MSESETMIEATCVNRDIGTVRPLSIGAAAMLSGR